MLNKFGHCISYDQLEELETAIAANVIKVAGDMSVCIPSNIKTGIFSTFCWDNNDLLEETLTGKGTTHCTNGIVLQKECDWCENTPQNVKSCAERKRSLKIDSFPNLDHFHSSNRIGPSTNIVAHNINQVDEEKSYAEMKNFCYILCRLSIESNLFAFLDHDQLVPGWTTFNIKTSTTTVPRKTVTGYLQVIDASPTELTTVNTVLKRSIRIADKLHQRDVVIVFDQAIYAKALDIIWQKPQEYDRVVLRMGAFHTACAFLAVIGKRFGDFGLGDLLIESGVIGGGSLAGVIEGRHYNRAMRLHKLVFEALQRIRWETFGQWLQNSPCELFPTEQDQSIIVEQVKDFSRDPSPLNLQTLLQSDNVQNTLNVYQMYCEADDGPMKNLWNSYLVMVEPVRHSPEAFDYLSGGGFAVQRGSNTFSQCAVDQTIEQTLNRDTKTRGGIVGFSVNKSAVHRWFLNAHERASISNACKNLAGIDNSLTANIPKELGKKRMQQDEEDIHSIISTVRSWSNPFEVADQLSCLSSGIVADELLQSDMLLAFKKGSEASNKFIEDRLVSKVKKFYDPNPRLSLQTFTVKNKNVSQPGKSEMIKADRNMFARLLVIAQSRQLNMKEVLSYELGPVPWSISNISGTLVKTNKSALCIQLEKSIDPVQSVPNNCVWIFDAMAVIQSVTKVPPTFGELACLVLNNILSHAKNAKRIDFVGDSYPEISIKKLERDKRAASGHIVVKITRSNQQCPRQWKKFLGVGGNKTSLLNFVVEEWSKNENSGKLRGKEIFVSHGLQCHIITVHDDNTVKSECGELSSNQEESDTKMFLHAKHAADHGYDNLLIKSSDTDVEVIACYFQRHINAKMFLLTGTSARSRILDVFSMCSSLGMTICQALPGFHAITGCDTVSALPGKGKAKAFGLMSRNDKYAHALSRLGDELTMSNDLLLELESYNCAIYGCSSENVNELRYVMFCRSKQIQCHQLPPTQDALVKHIKRDNFQTKVWKSSLECTSTVPSPDNHGWIVKYKTVTVHWIDKAPASDALLILISCSCKTGCSTRRCSCLSQGLSCTEGCKCSDICQNKHEADGNCDSDDEADEHNIESE